MKNMPSMDSGQNTSSIAQPAWSRLLTPMPSATVEPIAKASRTASKPMKNFASRPSPSAFVAHRTLSRPTRPSWKVPEVSDDSTSSVLFDGSVPKIRLSRPHETAPMVRSMPRLK